MRINVDDFGLCPSNAKSIGHLLSNAVVQSASLLAVGEGVDEAFFALKVGGFQSVGLHACWVAGERSLTGPSILTDGEAFFVDQWESVRRGVLWRKEYSLALVRELRAQAAMIKEEGLVISHLDSHQHQHVTPPFHSLFLEFAGDLGGVPIRIPRCRRVHRRPIGLALNVCSRILEHRAAQAGVPTYRSFGFEHSGHLHGSNLNSFLGDRRLARDELMTHACIPSKVCANRYAKWNYEWMLEYKALWETRG